jgi:quercetin dioxygenase-like cupin family protein
MRARRRWKTVVIAGVAMGLLGVTVQSATTAHILVDATIPSSKVFEGPVRLTVRELTLKPGEALPLHYHPGHVFIAVKTGTLTVEDGCGEQRKLTSGQGVEEWNGRVHRGKNVDATDAIVYDIFFTSPTRPTTVTIPANERRCGPPRDVDECTNDGWREFNHPRTFVNQAECTKFVRAMPRTLPFPTAPRDEH